MSSPKYPYSARALMRFKSQDGCFTLTSNQIVTVISASDEDGDWVQVTDQQGVSGSVPAGFLVEIEEPVEEKVQPEGGREQPTVDGHREKNHDQVQQTASSEQLNEAERQPPLGVAESPQELKTAGESNIQPPELAKGSEDQQGPLKISSASSKAATHNQAPATDSKPATPSTPLSTSLEPSQPQPNLQNVASSKQPPPPAAKPNSLRDRIAMFNKPLSAASPSAPSPVRPKPPLARKPMAIPSPAPPIDSGDEQLNSSLLENRAAAAQSGGMSAADAEESVRAGGSLKDRIKLLQQQRQSAVPEPTPATAPKPKREWKRPQLAAGEEVQAIPGMMPIPPTQKASGPKDSGENQDSEVERPEELTDVQGSNVEEEEEEEEAARRRRIAERMAKLGGAKMGFGIPPPLVPKPAPVVQDPVSVLQSENLATESSQTSLPPERIALPPMPKRAGPPRRKTPVPTPTGQEANQRMEEYQKSQDDILTPPQLVKNLENPVEQGSPSGRPGPLEIDQEHLEEKIHDQNKKYSEDDDHHKSDQKNIGPPSDKSDSPKIEKFEPPIQEDQSSAPVHEQLLSSNTNDRNQLVGASHTYAVTEGSVRPNSQEEVTNEDHPEIDSRTLDMCSNEEGTLAEVHEKGQEFESEMRTEENNVDKPQVRSYLEESDLSKQLDDSVETEEKSGNLDALTNQPEYSDMKNDKHAPAAPPRRPLPPTLGAVHHDDGRQLEFPEEAEESLADEKSPSRVKTMLAGSMGLPPLSPRPNTRKPSGPREPKSPLTSIQKEDEIDKQSTVPRDLEASSAENVAVVSSDYHAQPDPHLIMDEETPSEYQKKPDSMDSKRLETENEETRTERVEDCEANDYEEEDEETSRRRRLAERMAKMGGRSMMGPMFSPVGSGSPPARRPSSNRAPPQLASQSTSYSPTIRKLPSPPRKPPPPRLPSSDSLPVASINLPPLPRSAPPPANPDLTFDKSEETEYEVQPPPPVPPKRPSQVRTLSNFENPPSTSSSSPPPASPSVRPSIPFGYQDALRRSNTRSQSNSSGLEERVLSHQKELEERGRELIDGSPPQPPPQPKRSLPSLPPGVPASSGYTQHNEDKESPSHPSRSGSFESSRSGNRRRSGLNEQQDLKTGQSPGGASRFAKPTAEALLPEVSYSSSRMGFKARDLDLASERWWRHRPVAPPSSVSSMKDVLVRLQGSSTLQKGKSIYQYELVVIRDDYSKTIVNIKFDDNDDESGTEMNQLHYPPPEPYDISALQELGQTLGPQIVARAKAKEDEKGFKGEEDGASLVKTIVRSLEVALEPVGQTYGEVVYKCEIQDVKGAHPEIEVKDDIRPGDIVASYGATFKGKGIGHGSMNLGTVSNPHLGIVAEHDVKKNKFKAYGIFHGKVELISYRLDEMKSGCIKVFRVLDKDFLEN